MTTTDFLNWSGYQSTEVNMIYLAQLITWLNDDIQEKVGSLFTLTTIGSLNLTDPYIDITCNNTNFIRIGAWQKSNLVVKTGLYGSSNPTLTTLVLNQDYKLKSYREVALSSNINPVVGIELLTFNENTTGLQGFNNYNNNLYPLLGTRKNYTDKAFIRLTGTYGWSNGLPSDLQMVLYQLVKENLEYNQNVTNEDGKGLIDTEKDLTSSVSYVVDAKLVELTKATAKNIMANPAVAQVINNYRRFTTKNVIIS